MGWARTTVETRPTIEVVASGKGRLVSPSGARHPKARLWVLADRTAVVCLPDGNGVRRVTVEVESSVFNRAAETLVVLAAEGEFSLDMRGCGCGMGAVGNAGPIDGSYRVERVRAPEWHEVI